MSDYDQDNQETSDATPDATSPTPVPLWRQALNDADHPLHNLAWIVFSSPMNLHYADRKADELPDEMVMSLLSAILEDRTLHREAALGQGKAAINAIRLVEQRHYVILFRLLAALIADYEREAAEVPEAIWDAAIVALEHWHELGFTELVLPTIGFARDCDDSEVKQTFATILVHAPPGDADVVAFLQHNFEAQHHNMEGARDFPLNLDIALEALVEYDPSSAVAYLEARLAQEAYPDDIADGLQRYIAEARAMSDDNV